MTACNTVGMEPLSYGDLLLGKSGGDDLSRKGAFSANKIIFLSCEGDLYRVFSALCILGNVDIDPERLKAACCGELALSIKGLQKIGIKAGLAAKEVLILTLVYNGKANGNVLYGVNLDPVSDRAFYLHSAPYDVDACHQLLKSECYLLTEALSQKH